MRKHINGHAGMECRHALGIFDWSPSSLTRTSHGKFMPKPTVAGGLVRVQALER